MTVGTVDAKHFLSFGLFVDEKSLCPAVFVVNEGEHLFLQKGRLFISLTEVGTKFEQNHISYQMQQDLYQQIGYDPKPPQKSGKLLAKWEQNKRRLFVTICLRSDLCWHGDNS